MKPVSEMTARLPYRGVSIAILWLLAAGGALTSGCVAVTNYDARPIAPAELPEYSLEVEVRGEPEYDADRYEISLGFELIAEGEFSYNCIVQEIVQEVVYRRTDGRTIRETLTLVEAFKLHRAGRRDDGRVIYRLPSFQRDRHYERGYLSVGPMIEEIDVWRVVRFYPGFVEGADWTRLGFAHLPENRTGSLVTDIPENFNETHQSRYDHRGRILQDDRERARWYHMRYHWWRDQADGTPRADFRFVKYGRPVDEPEWLKGTLNHGARTAKAGE